MMKCEILKSVDEKVMESEIGSCRQVCPYPYVLLTLSYHSRKVTILSFILLGW